MACHWITPSPLLLVFLLLGTVTAAAAALPLPFIRTAPAPDRHFYDSFGRVRIFHGVNRVKKGFPWYFSDMHEADNEAQLMKEMGVNVVRLGFMWSGYNPAEGIFNTTYGRIMSEIIDRLATHGIHTLIDMHEDVLSSKFCLYDGAPLWVINKSVPKHPFPWPLKGNCSSRGWMINTLSEAAATAYQDIYDNRHGMLDNLVAFWEQTAQLLANKSAVIGYETMNEPFAGNFYADPLLLVPGVAGRKNLMRMHEAVAQGIRRHDKKHIVFYEPVTWGMILNGEYLGTGFDHVPGGDEYQNVSALSYHYYCATFLPAYGKEPVWRRAVCDSLVAPLVFRSVGDEVSKTGGALLMTEGLSCNPANPDSQSECEFVMNQLDHHLYSWTDYGESQGESFTPPYPTKSSMGENIR